MKDWRACIRTWEKRQVKTKPTSKIDKQLDSYQKAINIIKNNNEN